MEAREGTKKIIKVDNGNHVGMIYFYLFFFILFSVRAYLQSIKNVNFNQLHVNTYIQ